MKLITTHLNADFDALSSMVAAKKLYPDAMLAFPGSQEKSVRDFLIRSTVYFLDIAKPSQVDIDAVDTLILVDTKTPGRIGEFSRLLDKKGMIVHVYDHHPATDEDIHGEVSVFGTSGACVTTMIGILKERGIDITPEEATVMMLGIYEETGSFHYPSTTVSDFEAAAFLLSKGAHVNIVSEILVKELSPEQVLVLHDLIEAAAVHNINGIDIVLTEGSTADYVGDLAMLVQKFRDMENLNAVFALFRMDDRVYIIGRSRVPEVDAGTILSLLGGGGHKEAASATMKDITIVEARGKLIEILRHHVKPLWEAQDIMFFPVKTVGQDATISEARDILTKYSINALPVTFNGRVTGVITRQVVEKAVFHKLENIPVKEYMYTEFATVAPEDSIERVKEIIIGGSQRFLPVVRNRELVGAITRTDLLRVLEDEIRKSILGKLDFHDIFEKRKNIRKLMEERLRPDIIERLKAIGTLADELAYHAYLVGGVVRDLLLRNDNFDIDIVVEGDGIRFAEDLMRRYGLKIRPHKEFGTAKVTYPDGFKIDIATARLEYYRAPATLPVVEHSSLKLDLYRRDFTINTLAISLNKNTWGELIDFFGAQRDMKEKVIRVLHSLSFVEDPTRVFRAVRFENRFGFQIGKYTLNLMKNAIRMGFLARIKGSRVWTELGLILQEEAPGTILRRLADLDLVRFIYPTLTFDREKERLFREMDNVLKWYTLLYKGPLDRVLYFVTGLTDKMKLEDIAELGARLEVPDHKRKKLFSEVERLRSVLTRLATGIRQMKRSEVYRLLKGISREAQLFIMAKTSSEEAKKAISSYITYADSMKPLVSGKALKQLGVEEGPMFGEILEALQDAKIDRGLSTKEDELAFVREYIASRRISR